MTTKLTRRGFTKALLASVAGITFTRGLSSADDKRVRPFSFLLLGDLHFDRLQHHDLEWLGKTKPDDLRQVREYSSISRAILPRLFESVRETAETTDAIQAPKVAFTAQVGDLVEGLCSSENLALVQNRDALEMVREANPRVPFLFTKGNHDITGPGASEAFKCSFYPFLTEQRAALGAQSEVNAASYAFEHEGALFCFFDAYDSSSLPWLEATLAKRTARHCFVIIHPPVVPYGARATWHLFASERDRPNRERLLEILGRNNAFVLSGHIHKYNLLVRKTPRGGRFLQLGLSSVIRALDISATNELSGVDKYNGDQVSAEPEFSPATEKERRAVYKTESPYVTRFEYADLPGHALVSVEDGKVTARVYQGAGRQLWRTLPLSDFLAA